MSELKAETIVPQGTTITLQMYPKADADKVIAEKDAKILALEAEVFKQKQHAELFLDERNYAETQLRHQKYKRCLAMAEWCEVTAMWCYQAANTLPKGFRATLYGKPVMIEPSRLFKRSERLYNWGNRWLALAEEPTWAKFLQLIHKEAK